MLPFPLILTGALLATGVLLAVILLVVLLPRSDRGGRNGEQDRFESLDRQEND